MMLKDKVQNSKFNVQRIKFNVQKSLLNVQRVKFKEEKRRDSQRASALLVCLTKKSFYNEREPHGHLCHPRSIVKLLP